MTHDSSHSNPQPILPRAPTAIVLSALAVTLVFLFPSHNTAPISIPVGIAVYALLYAALAIFSFRVQAGLCSGFQNLVPMAAFFSFGGYAVVLVVFIGAILLELGRSIFGKYLDLPPHTPLQAVISILFNAGAGGCSTLIASAVYTALGGTIPLTAAFMPQITSLAASFLVRAFLYITIVLLSLSPLQPDQQHWLIRFSVVELLVMPVSLLLAVSLNDGLNGGFLLLSLGSVMVAGLFRSSERSRRELEQRLDDLATINRVGQTLSSSLAPEDLIHRIYEQVQVSVNAPLFFVALLDQERHILSFPFVMKDGLRLSWPPQSSEHGLSEYVIRSGAPLFLQGKPEDLRRTFAEMGIQPSLPETACVAAVPLIADNEAFGVIVIHSPDDPTAFDRSGLTLIAAIAGQASAALRNAQLYNQVYEMANKLALLNNVSSLVSASLELDAVLDQICKVVIEVGVADKVGVFLTEGGTALRLVHSIGLSEEFVAQFREIGRTDDSGPMSFLKKREIMAISDVHTDPRGRGWRTLGEFEGYISMLAIPLAAKDEVIGFFAIFYGEMHTFNPSEIELMNTLTNQVSVGIANARLYQDTQTRAGQLGRLYDSARSLNASLNLSDVVGKAIEALAGINAPDAVSIQLLEGSGALTLLGAQGMTLGQQEQPTPSALKAIRTACPVLLPQDADDLELMTRFHFENMMVFPLTSGERVFGLVTIGHRARRFVDQAELRLTEAMVNQTATAIRNAQLFNQVDIALDQRVNELSAIEAISRKISGALDLDSIITDVLDTALNVTQADIAAIALRATGSPKRLTLFERRRGGSGMATLTQIIDVYTGVVGRVTRTGKIARIPQIKNEPDYTPSSLSEIQSELCVPVMQEDKIIGAINLESRIENAFTDFHERFLINLAAHAVIAIRNAQLFEERDLQIGTLIRLRNLSMELISASSLQQVMSLIVEYTLIISRGKDVHLYLYDYKADVLVFGASLWLDGRENVEAKRPSKEGLTYQVARTGKISLVPDSRDLQRATTFSDITTFGAIARIPIKRGDRVQGVLVITYREPHHFSEDDVRLFELLSGQAAIAIENSRLFEEVSTARDRMRLVLDSTQDGIILVDRQSNLALFNRAAENILEYPLGAMIGRSVLRIAARAPHEISNIPNLDFWKQQIHDVLRTIRQNPAAPTRRQFSIQGTQPREIEEVTIPVVDEDGILNGRLIILRDVTEEKALKDLQESLTQMVHHDLRSPLANIETSLLMAREIAAVLGDPDLSSLIEVAISSCQDGRRLVDTLLDINKLQEGRLTPRREKFVLHTIVDSVLSNKSVYARAEEIRLLNLTAEDIPAFTADTDLIRRVITNLVENAIRHTPKRGEVRIESSIEPPLSASALPQVKVMITDTGKGVPVEFRERIFEMFVQVPGSNVRGRRGTGIGLTFCRLTVEAHGGRIWVENGPEGGARFVFTLPQLPLQTEDKP